MSVPTEVIAGTSGGAPASIDTIYQSGAAGTRETLDLKFPVVGRQPHLARLDELLARAVASRRQIVLVTGEPGIGKTTLIDVFVGSVGRRDSPAVWIGRGQCVEHYGSGEPYLPVMTALGSLARSDEHGMLMPVLRRYAPSWLVQLPALLDSDERDALQRQVIAPTRERMVRELAEALE